MTVTVSGFVGNLSRLAAVCKIIRRERLIILHVAPHTFVGFHSFSSVDEFDAFPFVCVRCFRGFRLCGGDKGRCPLDPCSL